MSPHEQKRHRIAALIESLGTLSEQLAVLDQKPVEGSGLIRQADLKNFDYALDSMENSVRGFLQAFK